MKKLLSVICVGVALTGCGGGGSGGSSESNSTPNSPVVPKEVLFDGKDTFYSYKLGFDAATTEKNTFTRKNDILYLKTNYPATARQYGDYFLTETELYQPETAATVNPSQGIRDSFIKSATDNELVTTPYNPQGFRGLEFNTKANIMDLKGKSIAAIVAPSDAAFISFYQNNPDYSNLKLSLISKLLTANDVFPEGAKCRQPVSTEYSKSNLVFQPNDETQVIPNVHTLQEWANQAFNDGIAASALVTKYNWAGYNWGALTLKNYDAQGRIQYIFAIEYQGKVYTANYNSGKLLFTDLLAGYRQYRIAQGVDQVLVDSVINNLKNSCLTYNEVAATVIDKAIEKAQKASVNSPITVNLPPSGNTPNVPNCSNSLSFC